jgi:F5/8 type C domain/Ricin-type beta-trefoil lectin domain-like
MNRIRNKLAILGLLLGCTASSQASLTWHWNSVPTDSAIQSAIASAMDSAVASYNTYSNYTYDIGVIYDSSVATADASYLGQIRFGGSRNYRVAMHEMSHYLGTGTYSAWSGLVVNGRWIGVHANAAMQSYDGPSAGIGCDTQHYWPYGANQDSEGVNPQRLVGLVGTFRRDMGLADLTLGYAPGTYRLRNRATGKMLDTNGSTADSAQMQQYTDEATTDQQWTLALVSSDIFTLTSVSSSKRLDSLGNTADGSAVGQSTASTSTTQQWRIQRTDSGYFKIVNVANGKCLDAGGQITDGSGMQNQTIDSSIDQEWKLVHTSYQAPAPIGVISQSRPVICSTAEDANRDYYGNDGIATNRWTATSSAFPQYWRVDLGTSQPMTKVVIDWYNSGTARSYQYRIEVSNDDTTYTTAVDKTTNTVQGTTTDTFSATARYVRIYVTGSSYGYAGFWECRVYNETNPMQLVSQGRYATASSSQLPNYPSNGNDGICGYTRWTAASATYPSWWQVDLGTIQPVNRAAINWFEPTTRYYQYRLEGSLDGTTFTTLVDKSSNTTMGNTVDTFSALARYVRVTVTGASAGYPAFYDSQIARNWTTVPSPWSTADIGAVAATGSASALNSAFTVTGSGADIAGTADEFRYVYQAGSADCSAVARVAAVQTTATDAKAGVMIRESTAANSAFAAVYITPGVGAVFQTRTTTGGGTGSAVVSGITAPRWVRIVRTGSSFAGYYSADGSTWTQIGSSTTISMATAVQLGLCVTSHLDGTLCSSIFDNVTATP